LKEFTDKNEKLALATGESEMNEAVETLSETKFPDFESFKAAREKTATDLDAKLQKNVVYPELSGRFMKNLNHLSTKKGLQFNISATEKEKEELLAESAQKEIESEKNHAELRQAFVNKNQVQTNVQGQSDYIRERSERDYREMKERCALDIKMREKQIQADLQAGFDKRAGALQKELQGKTQQTLQMMMQMQREANARQAELTQRLMEMKRTPPPEPVEVRRPRGLLTSILSPIVNLVDNLLPLRLGQE